VHGGGNINELNGYPFGLTGAYELIVWIHIIKYQKIGKNIYACTFGYFMFAHKFSGKITFLSRVKRQILML
jgi:hypothetical protein